jgi:hypothetical protein
MFAASSIVNPDDTNIPVLRNNLFYGGTLDLLPFGTSHSVVQDNLFDRTSIVDNSASCTYTGYNAYVTNCDRLRPTSAGDIILTNSPAYQTGPLGAFYQPTNSPLVDRGSESVDAAGLTGYTILTNQTPDTGTVDIGFHYRDFAIRPGFNQNILAPNDDGSTPSVPLPFTINFFTNLEPALYVNNNGNVTFDDLLSTYTPEPLVNLGINIIAPFWADVDTGGINSGVVTYGTNTVNGSAAFGVNWIDVGYYNEEVDRLNEFQLVLINRPDIAPGDFDMEFNYAQIRWEAGDVSGGCDGLWTGYNCSGGHYGGPSARAGYASASGTNFEFNGSGVASAFLDANLVTGLIHTNFNSNVLGRYVFQFRNGAPLGNP